MRQVLRAGALGRPRGIRWRGRWEGWSGWGIHVTPWLIPVNVWQNPQQCCEAISLQLIKINGKKKRKETGYLRLTGMTFFKYVTTVELLLWGIVIFSFCTTFFSFMTLALGLFLLFCCFSHNFNYCSVTELLCKIKEVPFPIWSAQSLYFKLKNIFQRYIL